MSIAKKVLCGMVSGQVSSDEVQRHHGHTWPRRRWTYCRPKMMCCHCASGRDRCFVLCNRTARMMTRTAFASSQASFDPRTISVVDGVTLNRKRLCSSPLQVRSEGGIKLHVCEPPEDDVGNVTVCRLGLREGRQTRAGLQSRWEGMFPTRVTGGSARRSNTSLTRKANTQPISNDRDVASQRST